MLLYVTIKTVCRIYYTLCSTLVLHSEHSRYHKYMNVVHVWTPGRARVPLFPNVAVICREPSIYLYLVLFCCVAPH